MTTTIYPIPGYPTVSLSTDGAQLTIRPMLPEDEDALLDFFRRIPPEDRFYLKEDVTDPNMAVRRRWGKHRLPAAGARGHVRITGGVGLPTGSGLSSSTRALG